MANGLNRLTAKQVAANRKPGMLADGGGLYLRTRESTDGAGTLSYAKSWVFVFFMLGRREMGLGSVKVVELAEARRLADEKRRLVARKIDPIEERKRVHVEQAAADEEAANPTPVLTFGTFADAYVDKLSRDPKTINNWRRAVKVHCLPIRETPLDEVGIKEVVSIVQPLFQTLPVSGEKALTYIRKILASATVQGLRAGDNPAIWVDNLDQIILDKPKPLTARGHHMALPYAELPSFMTRLRLLRGNGARGLELLILTAMRATEVCQAKWSEFDLDAKVWKVPGDRMKMGREHRVALSADAVVMLKGLDRDTDHLFPGLKTRAFIDAMTMTAVLRRMGVKDRCTIHGFRSTFRDWVGEKTEFDTNLAEIALAHKVGTEVEQAYARGDALEKRLVLMDAWASYCAGGAHAQSRAA